MSNYPFNYILLATEHTEFDLGAERLAFAMALRCGMILHVVFPLLSNSEYEADMPELALRDEQKVAVKITSIRNQAVALGVTVKVTVRRDTEIHSAIVAEANDSKADLIVIRRRGKPSFLSRLLVGEMVSKVIRDTSCSVLLVPRAAEFWNQHILAAVGDSPAAPSIAKTAGIIAGICGLPLTVLSVSPNEESLSKTKSLNTLNVALASSATESAKGEVRIGKPVEQTILAVSNLSADLVVVGRQRYNLMPFGNLSIMQDIAGNMDVPTLIVPA